MGKNWKQRDKKLAARKGKMVVNGRAEAIQPRLARIVILTYKQPKEKK